MRLKATALGAIALTLWVLSVPALAAQSEASDPPKVDLLAWLAGCWRQDRAEALTEECWLAPRGGIMLGLNRVTGGKRPFFEFLRIADPGDGLAYFANPSGQEPAAFPLVELGDKRVVFENPEHDFPQRIIYWLDDNGALHARIEGEVGGEPRGGDWVYQRSRWQPPG